LLMEGNGHEVQEQFFGENDHTRGKQGLLASKNTSPEWW
jgi:hypothetical protein